MDHTQFFKDLLDKLKEDGFIYLHFQGGVLFTRKGQDVVLFEAPDTKESLITEGFLKTTKGHRGSATLATSKDGQIDYEVESERHYQASDDGRIGISEWELQNIGVRVALEKLEQRGFEPVQFVSMPGEVTQVVATKDGHQFLFVCEASHRNNRSTTFLTNDQWSLIFDHSQAGEQTLAHARVVIVSEEDPFDPRFEESEWPIYRGVAIHSKVSFSKIEVADGALDFAAM